MAKEQRRKPPKRPEARPIVDDDLAELAFMLDERRLDKNAEGWFSVPWRDGWNAVALAREGYNLLEFVQHAGWTKQGKAIHELATIAATLGPWIETHQADASTYWLASDALVEIGSNAPLLRAAVRCVQVVIAKSDGGGEVYNAILRPAFEPYVPESIEQMIENLRREDALGADRGVTSYARRRRAFEIAWRRGLYRAAYAL